MWKQKEQNKKAWHKGSIWTLFSRSELKEDQSQTQTERRPVMITDLICATNLNLAKKEPLSLSLLSVSLFLSISLFLFLSVCTYHNTHIQSFFLCSCLKLWIQSTNMFHGLFLTQVQPKHLHHCFCLQTYSVFWIVLQLSCVTCTSVFICLYEQKRIQRDTNVVELPVVPSGLYLHELLLKPAQRPSPWQQLE